MIPKVSITTHRKVRRIKKSGVLEINVSSLMPFGLFIQQLQSVCLKFRLYNDSLHFCSLRCALRN
jgi:hypothetical protein